MRQARLLLALAAASLAFPAAAALTVIGNSSARLCYEAAESRLAPSRTDLGRCNEALAAEPLTAYEHVATLVNRGIVKARLGDPQAAIRDYDTALERNPDQAEAHLNKGMALLRLDSRGEAVRHFTLAIEKRTRKPAVAYYGRAVAHELSGEVRKAYFDYKQASALAPDWGQPRAELERFSVRSN